MLVPRRRDPTASADQREVGMTLLEVALALTLVAILALSFAEVALAVAGYGRLHGDLTAANTEIIRHLERFQATPFSELTAEFPDGAVIPLTSLPSGNVEVVHEESEEDLLVVRLDLSWDSPEHGDFHRSFHAVRTR